MTTTKFAPVEEQLHRLKRGAVDLIDESQLAAKLERSRNQGKPLTVKTGFDPSAPDLHLGHVVLLRKMRHFQEFGHRVVFLIGDFTAMIGDPSGKKATRPQLTREQVEENFQSYEKQVFEVLDRQATVVDFNSRWLNQLGSQGLIRLAGKYTLARMMEREDFRSRFAANQPISLHELLYPLAQGYDSIALEADVELGGHDQIFNLLVGRDLMKEEGLEPQVVLTVPLLVGTDGVDKMSKSIGNHIGIDDPPNEIYGKTMSIPDDLMWDWFLLLTDIPKRDLESYRQEIASGQRHPKALKQKLAHLLTSTFKGTPAADHAQAEFESIFASGGLPEDIEVVEISEVLALSALLAETQLAASRKEASRLIKQGAVTIDGEKQSDAFLKLAGRDSPYVLKVGKRRFLKVRITP
jgi:tyrosyl-tRNA synthetase